MNGRSGEFTFVASPRSTISYYSRIFCWNVTKKKEPLVVSQKLFSFIYQTKHACLFWTVPRKVDCENSPTLNGFVLNIFSWIQLGLDILILFEFFYYCNNQNTLLILLLNLHMFLFSLMDYILLHFLMY